MLDTATWDPVAAWRTLQRIPYDWRTVRKAILEGRDFPSNHQCWLYRGSAATVERDVFLLAGLSDGQQVFLQIGPGHDRHLLGEPLGAVQIKADEQLVAYSTHAKEIARFCRRIHPAKGPRALGTIPRLGIGTRMTTAVWPGIFKAMNRRGFAANAIQNSVRELNLLDNLRVGLPPEKNYACGFGTIESGYTGSTYEGLWVAGVLAALQYELPLCYGADADHIQVKRGPEGMARAKRLISAARYYSFFTLDMADVLDYGALMDTSTSHAEECLTRHIPEQRERLGVLEYHGKTFRCGGKSYSLDRVAIGKFVGKYWNALASLTELSDYIKTLKGADGFDLELTIDEHPPEISAFACLTSDEEILFLLREMRRREIVLTHIAPNFGVEKGVDYRCPDGLEGLEARIRPQFAIAKEFGVMLDFHSGDDLTAAPRRVIQRATQGWHHFKVSPMLQLIFAEVLQEFYPALFKRWWQDAYEYAEAEALQGSAFARQCLEEHRSRKNPRPSRADAVFHHYSFAFPGRRNARGQFLHRHEFYRLAPAFYHACQERICDYLCRLAEDLFNS
ncbi:MAG: hypothetical protein KGJ60_14530 [Verrucomicrobiota bacterium]|nr:hypothetical protein [Verrucomicrobiota bacterium]